MNDRLIDTLEQIPWHFILLLWVLYLGYGVYEFHNDGSSQYQMLKQNVESMKASNAKKAKDLQIAMEFRNSYQHKKQRLLELSKELSEMQATLTEEIDKPAFIQLVTTEAQRVGLTVKRLQPAAENVQKYYVGQKFEMEAEGVFVQFLVFFDRLSNVQKITKVGGFNLRTIGNPANKFVKISGNIEIEVYRYLRTEEDELAKQASALPAAPPIGQPQVPVGK